MEKEPQTGTRVQRATLRAIREGLAGSPTVHFTIRLACSVCSGVEILNDVMLEAKILCNICD